MEEFMDDNPNFDEIKRAKTDYLIHELIKRRWSPTAFSDRPIEREVLRSLFEAARWAPSSSNDQPWYYIIAEREDKDEFEKLLSCLTEGNLNWARYAPVLALGVARTRFEKNDKPNRHAFHDLGAASMSIALEATARGLCIHQMAGIRPIKARDLYLIPDKFEVVTAIAIGYLGEGGDLPEKYLERNRIPRRRRKISETVFGGNWGKTHPLVEN
jgi:nitroreductase